MKDIYKDKTIPQRKENNMAKDSFGGTELTTLELSLIHIPSPRDGLLSRMPSSA